jgi:predicted nucleotidyltransferase
MEMQLAPDFKEFLKLLNENGVKYLLIGGYAVGYHGYPRATNDLDVWIEAEPENVTRVVSALRQFGFNTPELTESLFLQQQKIIRMGIPPMRIEVATSISGVSFEECYPKRVVANMDGVDVTLISLHDLKVNKKASGRHKDLDDLEHLP